MTPWELQMKYVMHTEANVFLMVQNALTWVLALPIRLQQLVNKIEEQTELVNSPLLLLVD